MSVHRILLVGVVLCAVCATPFLAQASATELGKGNKDMKERFDAYRKRGLQLTAPPKDAPRHPRVLVTGFGLFTGVEFNISGVIAETLGRSDHWPARTSLAKRPELETVPTGILKEAALGARAWQRTIEIDGQTIELGVLLLDVLWDLGAAITLEEAKVFEPDFILMMGRGAHRVVFEAGAVNHAASHPGFLSNGDIAQDNLPRKLHVLDPTLEGVQAAIPMRWDAKKLADTARPFMTAIDKTYQVYAAPRARPENNYICNNISCAVLHGIARRRVPLAGGDIRIDDIALERTIAGFLHLPARATRKAEEIAGWCHAICAVIHAQLKAQKLLRTPKKAQPADAGGEARSPQAGD